MASGEEDVPPIPRWDRQLTVPLGPPDNPWVTLHIMQVLVHTFARPWDHMNYIEFTPPGAHYCYFAQAQIIGQLIVNDFPHFHMPFPFDQDLQHYMRYQEGRLDLELGDG